MIAANFPLVKIVYHMIFSICNMGTGSLPDMYVHPEGCGPRAEGVHIG